MMHLPDTPVGSVLGLNYSAIAVVAPQRVGIRRIAPTPVPYQTGWAEEVDQTFNFLHGDLMAELGYCEQAGVERVAAKLPPSTHGLLEIVDNVSARCASLQFHCDERLRVIKQLSGAKTSAAYPVLKYERPGSKNSLAFSLTRLVWAR